MVKKQTMCAKKMLIDQLWIVNVVAGFARERVFNDSS